MANNQQPAKKVNTTGVQRVSKISHNNRIQRVEERQWEYSSGEQRILSKFKG
jgi:hypothetical protein